ncbi:uncharacterized protein JCM15063_001004 [Sporobolomyces koalae]|uniref:uncharacterized protein n=1 Tax=Sporobolomyces koalae TaxID=500713 RepID=UPI00316EFC00
MTEPKSDEYSAILTHSALKGVQTVASVGPPVLLVQAIYRRSFGLSRYLRSVALSTFTVGPALGIGLAAYRMSGMGDLQVKEKAWKVKSNAKQQRCDDYSVIGGVLGALVMTTIFLKRARLPWVIGSGATFGVAGGVLTHTVKDLQEGEELHPVEQVKGAVGAKR